MENRLPNYKKSLKNCYAMYVALPCIAQEYSNAILEPEPLSLAYLLRQSFNISQQFYVLVMMVPCLKCSFALQKIVQRNRFQPPHSCKTYSCQRAQGSAFFETKAVARELIWSIPVTRNFAVQRIRAKWLDWTTRSCYFGALVYPSIAPKAPKGLGCEWVPLVQRVSSM